MRHPIQDRTGQSTFDLLISPPPRSQFIAVEPGAGVVRCGLFIVDPLSVFSARFMVPFASGVRSLWFGD